MVQPASAIVLNRLGAERKAVLDTECQMPTSVNPASCKGYKMPKLPANVKCAFSDKCTGVECCSAMDLKITSRNFKVWFDIDPCDYTLSVGFERMFRNISLIGFKFGKEKDIKVGKNLKLYYMLDRTVSNGQYIISMRYKTCLDDACEDTIILSGLKLGVPFCDADGSLSWPLSSYGRLLPNIIGSELTLLRNPSCTYEALKPGTNCADYALPTFGKQYCVMDKTCRNIACCFPSDLVVETKNLYFNFKIDHCKEQIEYAFEKKKFARSLIGFEYGVTHVELIGTAITLSYIIRDNGGRYQVRAEVKTCFVNNWDATESCRTDTLLAMTYYKKPVCSKRKRRSLFGNSRTRRSALIQRRLNNDSPTSRKAQEQMIAGAVKTGKSNEEIARMFAKQKDTTVIYKTGPNAGKKVSKNPKYPPQLTVFQRAKKALAGKGPASHQKPKVLTSKSVPASLPGAAKVIEMLGDGSDKDMASPATKTFLFGKGLTANGIHLLGLQLANMSISDLEVFVIMARLDPIQMYELAMTMKDLFVTLYNEMIDVFTNPDKLKEFANEELILKGSFPMPKTTVTFFKRTMYFLVGMLIPMTFSFGADGYYGADCTLGVKVLQMSAFAEVTPYTGILVWGELGIGALLYGKLRLEGYICELRFPTYAEIWFMTFPFDVMLKMDLEIIPLKLKLIALVTLEVDLAFVTIKKVLFSMNLWEYTAPSIRTNIFTVNTKDEDKSPPEFAGKDSTSGKRGAATRACEVTQLAGRDFTDPGFEISVRANDDRSQVKMILDIGSAPGGSDLVTGLELGGENNDFIQDIPLHGLPVFFKITGSNSAGSSVYVTCDLPTYDVTLPIGRMNTDFISTSNPRVLRGSLVAMEDSPLVDQNVGIGYGKEIYGDAVVEWYHFDLKPNVKELGTSGDTLAHFTGYKIGRVNSKIITFSGSVGTPQECASKCLAFPAIKCMSFNFDFSADGTCECLEAIEGPENILSEDGMFYHYERLGIGHAVQFEYQDMWLQHNNLYYINVQLINYIEYESIVSTEGILFDGTPPYPGPAPNATEFNEWVDCHTYIPFNREDWRHLCHDVSKEIHNHRITHDGDDAATVFNGIEPLEDLKYTRANRFISVNWDGIHDYETGIHGYTWTVGLAVCEDLIHPHHDPQAHLYDESEWTHSGTIYPIPPPYEILPDAKYYTTIRALNKVAYGGPMSLSVCHTTPLGIDNTPPIFYEMYNFAYNETSFVASLDYNATDPESDVMFVDACMGQTSRDCYLVPWVALNGNTGSLWFQAEIPSGMLASPKIKIGNHVLLTTIGVGAPIIIDLTPPEPGEMFDGPHFGYDLNFTKDATQICASWKDFADPESGISKYELGLGTKPDAEDVIERIEYHGRTTQACIDTVKTANLTLQHNTRYYFTIWAWNNAQKMLFVNVSTDGVVVDLTVPVAGEIVDGGKNAYEDLVFSSKPATVEAQWRNYYDPESHVIDYEVEVEIAGDMGSNFQVEHSYESVFPDEAITWHHFHLHHRDIIKSKLRTTNGALNFIESETNSFVVDLTPPNLIYLNDGPTAEVDIDYSSNDNMAANWDFHDEESGVKEYDLALYEMYQGTKRPKKPETVGQYIKKAKTMKTIQENSLGLINGAAYFTENMATNQAELSTVYKTNSFKVDKTGPMMQFVHVGVFSGFTEEVVDEHCWQARTDSIIGSWKAIDGQSGIEKYMVAVGTSPGSTDVSDFVNMKNLDQGIIGDLVLPLTDRSQNPKVPLYYLTVKAMNGAGLWSSPLSSEHGLIVVDEDKVGLAIDGPEGTENPYSSMGIDMSYTKETSTVTIQFEGFESQLHGLKRFEWAIGRTPHHEDVQPFIEAGIVLRNDPTTQANIDGDGLVGAGKATVSVDLEVDVWYYASVRGITYGDNILECVTDGFVIDRTAPSITLESVGMQDGTAELGEDGVVYEMSVDSYTAEWHYTEQTSYITAASYSVGTHPEGDDISGVQNIAQIKPAYFDNIPNALFKPVADGRPNVLTVHAVNFVGLASKVISATITIDTTPPTEGTVVCPRQISAVTEVQCTWYGFFEAQSEIVKYRFAIGSQEGFEDIYSYADVDPSMDRHMATNFLAPFEHKKKYYVTVEAENSVGLKVWAYSKSIAIDNTPPKYGVIVETAGISQLDWKRGMYGDEQSFTCETEADCMEIDAICQESLAQVAAAWTPFTDDETGLSRYQLAVGTSPGGANIKQFFDIPVSSTHYVITDLDLNGVRQIFVTIKGYNGAGLFSITISNGIYLTYLGQGLQPLKPVEVWDNNDPFGDKDFQSDSEQLSARWDFTGDPCPIIKYYWAIYRIDNIELQPWTDTQVNTFALNDEMNMGSGQTFFVRVKGINAIGMEFNLRSDGITIQKDPLIPGRVNDGNVFGYDLLYLPETTSVKANWDGFGVQTVETARAETLSGNAGIIEEQKEEGNRNQEVEYYEIAIGSDRRYPKTRDNILPFTNVGKNKTVTIFDLDLIPRTALYYITIRAHSASLAEVEVTSNGFYCGFDNGVEAGKIDLQDFWQHDDYVKLQWSGFKSEVELLFYNIGISNSTDPSSYSCKHLTSKVITSAELASLFPILYLSNVGKNQLAEVFNMTMEHTQTYYAYVIATDGTGECNMTSKHFTVDVTDPVEGAMKTGPYWDMVVTYAPSSLELEFSWEGYSDADSDLREFQVALLYVPTCEMADEANITTLVDWITIPGNYTTYKFVELDLQPATPYYIHLRTINNADRMILTVSNPILLDNSVPTVGEVIIGTNFLDSMVWNKAEDEVFVNFLHLQVPFGPSCPDQAAPLFAEDWYVIETSGLLNPGNEPWKIEYRESEIIRDTEDNDTIIIAMVQDTKKPLMYSGAYSRNADMVNGGHYQIDIKAAEGDQVATSIVFWDGPDGVLGDVNYKAEKDWTEGNCLCCAEDPVPVTCTCDCVAYLEDKQFMVEAQLAAQRTNETTVEPSTAITEAPSTTPAVTSAPVPWFVVQDKKPGQVVYDAWEEQPAYTSCGMSLHSKGGKHYAVGWCRSGNDSRDLQSTRNELLFDPREWHTYKVEFNIDNNDPSMPHWCFNVFTDEFNIVEVCGIDAMSTDTKMILHVWNANNHIPAMADAFSAFKTEARFKAVRFPPSSELECRYGTPFRGGTNAIIRYEAAVGTSPGLTDIMPYSEAVVPCVPCNNPCDRFFCNETCVSTITESIMFSISNISMPMVRNEMNSTGHVLSYNKSLPYFVSLKAVLGSGQSVIGTSMSFYIDLTPPTVEINVMYIDMSLDPLIPVQYQASNDTIKALWKCDDGESLIKEYQWAIGTAPNMTDVQNFTSTGVNPSGINDQLAGFIEHNTTYYVTVKCKNNARLETMVVDHIGITAILELPVVDDVNNTIPGAEAFDHAVYPETAKQAKDPTKAGVSWTKAADPTINRYEYCLGSSNETLDDVFPCTWVGYNASGVVEIKSGSLYLDGAAIADLSSYVVPNADTNLTEVAAAGNSGFAMEPGRTLFTTMRICNEAEVCIYKFVSTVTVTDDGAQLESSTNGEAITASLSDEKKRKKRSSSRDVSIVTPSGMSSGQSIILGALSSADLTCSFESGGSVDFSPFVVDPQTTTDMTTRLLQNRITSMPSDSFYLAPLAHTALPDAMEVTVSYEASEISDQVMPMLIHWDPDSNAWMVSNETCSDSVDDRHILDEANMQFTTKLCRTRTSNSTVSAASRRRRRRRRRRRSLSSEEYFAEETQFVVATILREVPNNAPNVTAIMNINLQEDAGTLSYQLSAVDPDGDSLLWSLDSTQAWTSTGTATLSSTGFFTYRPCLDCYGMDMVAIEVYEDRTDDVTALYTYANLTILVTSTKDNPQMFVAHFGHDLFPTSASYKTITINVEQNTPENVAYTPWIGKVGAYDADSNDTLSISILSPSHGSVLLTAGSTNTPNLPSACDGNEIAEALPCDVTLDHATSAYSWKLTTLVYTPDSQFYGLDGFSIIIEDSGGKYSDVFKVTVAVLENPCTSNSTCVGQTDDVDCTATKRATIGFLNEYSCNCLPGWTGDTCDTDYDECNSAPCIYPYACFDKFNGYECGCPTDWLICDTGLTPMTVGIIAIAFVLVATLIAFIVWHKRSKLGGVLGDLMPIGNPNKAYYNINTRQKRSGVMAKKGQGFDSDPVWTTKESKAEKATDDASPPSTAEGIRRPESVDFDVKTPEPPPASRVRTTEIDTDEIETEEAPTPVYFKRKTVAAKNRDKAQGKKLSNIWKEMQTGRDADWSTPTPQAQGQPKRTTRIQSISIPRLKKGNAGPTTEKATTSKSSGRTSTKRTDSVPGSFGDF
ncbi:uncharacterized protein LOC135499389 [Lineus longissimus]|uniref:uncharacterized protein LOC135499389 n=1 Tax=Lineus longissimus TaxID=88925 RepID=UPI00315CB23F